MLASLGLPLRQHCQFLTLEFFVKKTHFFKDLTKKKADCRQWLIISFLQKIIYLVQ